MAVKLIFSVNNIILSNSSSYSYLAAMSATSSQVASRTTLFQSAALPLRGALLEESVLSTPALTLKFDLPERLRFSCDEGFVKGNNEAA